MRVLLDECVPRRLRSELSAHDVHTVAEMGWSGKKNGELLQLMSGADFDALLTVDQGLPFQQNLVSASIAVVVMVASSNAAVDLLPLMPAVDAALASIKPGDIVEVRS